MLSTLFISYSKTIKNPFSLFYRWRPQSSVHQMAIYSILTYTWQKTEDTQHATPSIKRRAQLWRRGCRAQPAYLSTTVRASLNLAANTSPVKYSAKRPTACSRELKSRSEQCRRRQSFSAVMFSLCPGIQHLLVLQRRTNFSCNKKTIPNKPNRAN